MKIFGNDVPEHIHMGTPKFSAAVPSDSTVLSGVRRVYCVTAGTLVATNDTAADVPIAMTAGQSIEISPTKIKAATTGTYVLLF